MNAGYYASPWPGEDAGPARLQRAPAGVSLSVHAGERLHCTTRDTILSTMTVLGDAGEVYLLTHSALRAHLGMATTACVERIDPHSLRSRQRSTRLPGGPMWPGGMAIHRNGDIYVVYGRYAHRLDRGCGLKASFALPLELAYNSFVILDNGRIVTKNLSDTIAARLTVLDADSLRPVCADLVCPEPSIARLSAAGNTVYVVGVRSIFRYHWDDAAQTLRRDSEWSWDYVGTTTQTYGWDAVIDGRNAWFMDNGLHRYRINMRGAGVRQTPNRLLRVSLSDAADHSALEVSALRGGSITNPPLVDLERRIVVGFDSANSVLCAWRLQADHCLVPLWRKEPFGVASHLLLYPGSGELVVNDYRRFGEEVVVLDIETGQERARVRSGGLTQGVVFPSVGWERDLYWCSMGRLARIFVA
ncbi:MAG: hypothetical protein ACKOWD_19420 [Rhodoferax sp.]